MKYVPFEEVLRGFIGDRKVRERETNILIKSLGISPGMRVIDLGGADGATAKTMNEQGIRADCVEVDSRFCEQARKTLAPYGATAYHADWRDLSGIGGLISVGNIPPYDAMFSEGNSFPTYIPPDERAVVMRNFSRLLKPGGMLSIDFRNYETWSEEHPIVLKNRWHYSGKEVSAAGIRRPKGGVTLTYTDGRRWSELSLYTVGFDEVKMLLGDAGFRVQRLYVDGEQKESIVPEKESASSFIQIVGQKIKD